MAKRILIVDDDALMRRSLAFNLEKAGYIAHSVATAEDGISFAQRQRPDLVLLDIGLPGMDGLDAVRLFKEQLNLPVIFLTARRRELDEILGLELGADDFVTKPFDVDVLLAHIKAVLRRFKTSVIKSEKPALLCAGDLNLDPISHVATLNGKVLELAPREFDLLHVLLQQPGKVFSVDELLSQVWGAEFEGQPQVVYVHIRWLREKIEQDANHPKRLKTVRGVGYKILPGE